MLSSKEKCVLENWQKIADYKLKIWELFLNYPRFIAPKSFLWNRLKIEIYTGAFAESPFGKETISWASGVGIGGILAINGKVVEFSSLEVNAKILPWLNGLKSARRLISFFELLSTYIGLRLWTPNRLENNDI